MVLAKGASIASPGEWLTLKEASRLLGVHGATLRKWTSQGKVRAWRTVGGHRRFRVQDIQDFLARAQQSGPDVQKPLSPNGILSRINKTPLLRKDWYLRLRDDDRERRAEGGRRLLGLLVQYVSCDDEAREILEEARQLAAGFGVDSAAWGLSTTQVTETVIFFRDSIIEATFLLPEGTSPWRLNYRRYMRMKNFFNEVVLATLQAYENSPHLTLSPV